jgi:hypothetical protein
MKLHKIYDVVKKKALNNSNKLNLIILLFTLLLLLGCGKNLNSAFADSNSKNQDKLIHIELERNRRLWKETKILNYNFECHQIRGGMYSWAKVLIQVRNEKAISIKPVEDPSVLTKLDGYEDIDTFEKIFDKIEEGYENDYIVEVTYNEKYGYPEKTTINSQKHSHSNVVIETSNFQIIDGVK